MALIKKYWILIIVLSFIILRFLKLELFQDYLGISKIKPDNYFLLIISSLSSLLGIIIAVLLVTFQLTRRNSGYRPEKDLFRNSDLKNFFSYSVTVILLSFYCFININSFDDYRNITAAYFLGYLYVIFIISLLPITDRILRNTNLVSSTLKDIKSINITYINTNSSYRFKRQTDFPSEDILIKIKYDILNYILDDDTANIYKVLKALNQKVLFFIADGTDRNKVSAVLNINFIVWDGTKHSALNKGNTKYLNIIWECIDELLKHGADKNINLLHYQDLIYYAKDLINYQARKSDEDSLIFASDVLMSAFQGHIKSNCPPENEIILFYPNQPKNPKYKSLSSLHWNYLLDLLKSINLIAKKGIEMKSGDVFRYADNALENTLEKIIRDDFNLGKEQKFKLITYVYYAVYENYGRALSCNFETYSLEIYSQLMLSIVEEKLSSLRHVLNMYNKFLVGNYDRLHPNQINSYAWIVRGVTNKIGIDPVYTSAIHFNTDTLIYLKNKIESENKVSSHNDIYLEIKKCIIYTHRSIPKSIYNMDYVNKLQKVIESFLEQTNDEQSFSGVKWIN